MSDYTLNDDGTINFNFDSFTRVLKRPNLRQYRTAVEALTKGEQRVEGDEVNVRLDFVIGWFDEVIAMLAGEGFPRVPAVDDEENPIVVDDKPVMVIDEDRLPAWLLKAELMAELVIHWRDNPSHRGGR